jgi:hypothetical protein
MGQWWSTRGCTERREHLTGMQGWTHGALSKLVHFLPVSFSEIYTLQRGIFFYAASCFLLPCILP